MKCLKIQCLKAGLSALISLFAATNVQSQCVASGHQDCSSFSNDASVGTLGWSNVSGAQFSDLSVANAGVLLGLFAQVNTKYLVVKNPGFTIPAYATICGISADIEEAALGITVAATVKDNSVKIVKNNTISGTEHASGANWTLGNGYTTYGSPTDLWGLSWLPADVNSGNFGIAISTHLSFGLVSLLLTAEVNHIRITVYYDSSSVLSSSSRDFEAVKAPGKVDLQWTDVTASATSYFIVEKSADGQDWQKSDSIPAMESKASAMVYHSVDWHPGLQNYYRLWQSDINGLRKGSDVLSVRYADPLLGAMNIYPNPAHGLVSISLPGRGMAIRAIKVADLCGRQVPAPCLPVADSVVELNTAGLPPGIYLVRAFTQSGVVCSRLVVR